MPMATKQKLLYSITFIILLSFSVVSASTHNSPSDVVFKSENIVQHSQSSVENFRSHELKRIIGEDSPKLDVVMGEAFYKEVHGKRLKHVPIKFTSVNWVGSHPKTIWLEGMVIYPTDIKKAKLRPAIVIMHGLNGEMNPEPVSEMGTLIWAEKFAGKGFVSLTYNHPGHVDSEGAKPSPENWGTTNFNQSEHIYLTIAACIRAVALLESLPEVDTKNIFLSGGSYGGLNTMIVSAIYYDHIKGGIPVAATGYFEATFKEKGKLLNWVLGQGGPKQWDQIKKRNDPYYYITNNPNCPPQLLLFGTNDEFLSTSSLNATIKALELKGAERIFPNGHHFFYMDFNDWRIKFRSMMTLPTIFYWIDHVMKEKPLNIKFHVNEEKIKTSSGDSLLLRFYMDNIKQESIDSVWLSYHLTDIIGEPWRTITVKKPDGSMRTWETMLDPPLMQTRVEYFFQVSLKTKYNGPAVFSSTIYRGPELDNHLGRYLIIFLTLLSLLLPCFIIFMDWRNIPDDSVSYELAGFHENHITLNVKTFYMIKYLAILSGTFFIMVSFFSSWVVFGNNAIMDLWYICDNYLNILGVNLSVPIFIIIYLIFLISFKKPFAGGLLNLIFPLILFILLAVVNVIMPPSAFGDISAGIGPFIFLTGAMIQVLYGIFSRLLRKV